MTAAIEPRRFDTPAGPLTARFFASPSAMYIATRSSRTDGTGLAIDTESLAAVTVECRVMTPGYHGDTAETVAVNGVPYRVDIPLRLADDGRWIMDRTGGAWPRMERVGRGLFGDAARPTDKANRYLMDVIVPAAIAAVNAMPEEIDRALAVRADAYAESQRALAARLRALADAVEAAWLPGYAVPTA